MKRKTFLALLAAMAVCGVAVTACGPVEQPPIKIGVEGPMTGEWSYEGEGFRRAVLLLADQVNEEGGMLDGRPVEIVVGDDRGDPEEAQRVARRMVDDAVIGIVGAYNSDATEASAEVYDAAGVLQITPSSTAIRLTEKGYERFFRTCFFFFCVRFFPGFFFGLTTFPAGIFFFPRTFLNAPCTGQSKSPMCSCSL